jgi:GAF domain-containing protein
MAETSHIARALAEAARMINAPGSLDETLDVIVRTAQKSLPGVDHVGLSIAHRDGRIETVAATAQLVYELDAFQYANAEGPCYYSVTRDPVTVAEDLAHDERWPRYAVEAVARGVQAQMGLRLYTDRETIGALNLYSMQVDTFDEEAVEVAQLFATHASLTLGRARSEEQLNAAIESRQLIGQAVGIVMERYGLTQDRAFAYLARASSTSNVKIRDIAQELVESLEARRQADRS